MKFEIKARVTGSVLFECEAASLKIAVEKAIEARASLAGANLAGANLVRANLVRANLSGASLVRANLAGASLDGASLARANLAGANLSGANLSGASLDGANLDGANLDGANLSGASLVRASLDGASLDGANLAGANLSGASLSGASLDGANLDGANLDGVKEDFFARLSIAKQEVAGLYKAVCDGKIDGSAYRGECACFVGTIANVRQCDPEKLKDLIGLEMDVGSPTERWFLALKPGMTESHPVVKITAGWIREWAKTNDVKLPERTVVWS